MIGRKFHAIARVAKRKLGHLHAAVSLADLAAIPGNRLEALSGDRAGQHGILINDQWRISEIIHGRRSITAGTALRLARYFGTSAQFWVNLQANYDLEAARDALGDQISSEVKPRPAA